VSLAARSARAAAWNLAMSVGVRVIGVFGTLILTRFLSPHEYGEVAAAALCTSVVRLFSFQAGSYVIAHLSPAEEVFQAIVFNGTAITLGVVLLLLFQNSLGALLGVPGMTRFLPGLALALVVTQVSSVHSALLMRSLRFRTIAIVRSAGELVYTLLSVALAPVMGGFAIVVGNLGRAGLVSTAMVLWTERAAWFRPAWPSLGSTRSFLRFGLPLSLGSLAELTAWDRLLVSRFFGAGVLGQYSLASNLVQTPSTNVAEPLTDVLLPAFSNVGAGRRSSAFLRTIAAVGLLVTPLALGLGAVGPTLAAVALGPQWQGTGPFITILAGMSVAQPVIWAVGAYLSAERRTEVQMVVGFLRTLLVVGLLAGFGWAGPRWACAAVTLAFALSGVVALLAVRLVAGIRLRDSLGALLPPLVAGGLMFAAVLGARAAAGHLGLAPGWTLLAAEVTVGALTYPVCALVLARTTVRDLARIVREAFARRLDESAAEPNVAGTS
jgi:lipopolysaccharide exporter